MQRIKEIIFREFGEDARYLRENVCGITEHGDDNHEPKYFDIIHKSGSVHRIYSKAVCSITYEEEKC